jgi:AraC-like DNA-binding protein
MNLLNCFVDRLVSMNATPPLPEMTIADAKTQEWIVRAQSDQHRDWLLDAPLCQALDRYRIVHVGIAQAVHPYCVVRTDLSGTFVMVCLAGEGEVFLDGRWQTMTAGYGCLAPPHAYHAYRVLENASWHIGWVRYQEPPGAIPLVSIPTPVMAKFDGEPLVAAIRGLHLESSRLAEPRPMQLWVDLINSYAQAFSFPWRTENRLRAVWETVKADLARSWSIEELSDLAGLSPRQFRRVQQQSTGMTPKEYLTSLRIQHAIHLLMNTDAKVESIAHQVGYQSPFTFSTKFQAFTGFSPTEYRSSRSLAKQSSAR